MGIIALTLFIVTIITFSISLLLLKKFRPGANYFKNPLLWITTLFAPPLIIAGLIFLWYVVSSSYPERNFNRDKWATDKENRYEYVDDLVDHDKLIGLSKNDIKDLLGEPDNESDSTLTYYIGYSPKYFMNLDPDWLEIGLLNEKAISSRVLQ